MLKPLTMLLAMLLVPQRLDTNRPHDRAEHYLLLAALTGSLLGDVFLMLPGNWFIPGLASFLVAHLFYIALLRMRQHWFPSRGALAATLVFGAAMLAYLWDGLADPVLKAAVTIYVAVICLMAAQAIGRATVLRDRASAWVALGACVFMASDTLIAINRFVAPVPLAGLWVLSTYYVAQVLIVLHVRPATTAAVATRVGLSATTS